ncbi:kelch-like protein 10 [Odontesthes bonariensis]|uniref:kelch-like protein 10 n=1 Tax=Odontesthes bonariensis TaxID=219752 RepID=UPI003F58FFE2
MSTNSNDVYMELLVEGTLCDTLIRVGDVDFKVHRIILCNCSPYFRDLFCSNPPPSKQQIYNISDVSPNVMSLILEYIYTRSAVVTEDNVLELLAAAHLFAIEGITQACCDLLQNNLCFENCINIWKLADRYKYPDLMKKSYLYILRHFEEVAGLSQEFLELSVEQLSDLIEKDELNVKEESTLFEAILRWISHAPDARGGYMDILLCKVRLPLMPIKYLVDTVSKDDLVRHSMPCLGMVISTMRTLRESNMERPLTLSRLPSEVLLAVGGFGNNLPTGKIELYNVRTDRWVTVHKNEKVIPQFCGCVHLQGFVYCIGGCKNDAYLSSVQKFNIAARTWQEVGSMHVARCYVSVVVLNGYVYAMGGCNKYETFNSAERFKPDTNQWTLIAPMHNYRADAGATTLHGKVYICGGYIGDEALSSAECYNPEADQWTLITPMDMGRTAAGVIAYNDHIFVLGGYNGIRHVCSVASYDPVSKYWRTMAPMFHCRSNFGTAVLEDQLYVVGGFQNDEAQLCSKMERYDGKTDRWHNLRSLETPCGAISCCVVERIPHAAAYLS